MLKSKYENLIRDTFIIYIISFVLILALTIFFSYQNGEVVVDNFMLHFRSYLLGSIHTGEDILSARFENIGIFAIHFILFFTYFFLSTYDNRDSKPCVPKNRMGELCEPALFFIVGIILTIFLRENLLFCLPEALALASIAFIGKMTIFKNISIEDKYIIAVNRIFLIIISIIGLVFFIFRYI